MIFESFQALVSDYTLQVIIVGALVLGITAGALGCFAILRQQSLLGDAIAHATLPGVGLAFLITQQKSPFILLLGAGLAGWLASLIVKGITQTTRIEKDAALGMVLSVFFGIGLMIITIVQKLPTANKAGLDKFLFGNAATLLKSDVEVMLVLSAVVWFFLILFWKEFKVLTFDPDFAKSLGLRVNFIDIALTTLIVITIVIGLQSVGVVLMSAMLVAPAAAARQWTNNLKKMVLVASLFGATAGVLGAMTSSAVAHLPTGPTIVLYLSVIVVLSLFFAPSRGLLWDYIRHFRHRYQIQMSTMLKNLLLFSEIKTDPFHAHDLAALEAIGRKAVKRTMQELFKKGWVTQLPDKRWALTPEGLKEAQRLVHDYGDIKG